MKAFLVFCFCLNSVFSFGQVVDSAMTLRVNNLIDSSKQLTGDQRLDEAMQVGEAAQKLAEEKFGKESAEYARCLFNLGKVFYAKSNYDAAILNYQEAKAIREKILGKENAEYVWNLNSLANLYREIARYKDAEPLCQEALAIQEKVFGKMTPVYALLLNNVALLYYRMGRYEAAEPLYLKAKDIREKLLGKEHQDYAKTLNNLADLYTDMGRYEAAEPLYLQVKTIREKLGKESNEYAITLNALAYLYDDMGRYEAAEIYYEEVKSIWAKVLGKEHPYYAIILNNLASLYYNMGRYEAAEPLYYEANAISEKNFGKEHQNYATGLSNLAEVNIALRRYKAAESLHLEAKAIREKVLGKMHPDYARSLGYLALLYHRMGRYKDAEPLFLEAKSIREKVLGKTHPDYAVSLTNLANLYSEMRRFKDAETLYREANTITNALLSNSSRYLSDGELAAYVQTFTKDLDHYYSFAQTNTGELIGFSASCYNNALFHKGFLLSVSTRISNLAGVDTVASRLNDQLKSYHRRLAKEFAKPIAEREGIEELEAQANLTEKELIRTVAGFSEAIRQVGWQDVQAALSPGEAAVEFIHYRYYNPFRTDSVVYAALVLRPGDKEPRLIPLFEERQLARLLPKDNDMDFIDDFYKTPIGKTVFDLVWQPIESLLEGINTVYCSPSGLLHRMNLGAIPIPFSTGGHEKPFDDYHHLVLLGSTRQLVNQNAGTLPTSTQALLFGGINYDVSADLVEKTPTRDSFWIKPSMVRRSLAPAPFFFDTTAQTWITSKWSSLPGTETEVRNICEQFQKHRFSTQLLTGSVATEEHFKQLGRTEPSPRILHLATHGYFFPDPTTSLNGYIGDQTSLVFKSAKQPMMRSGLILAGANTAWVTGHPPAQREDGILTAFEISQMNLSNTELVVLSACETGLGQIEGNEGVYGLQRAFKIAGARYLIMSLWQVNDQKTGELMIEFYRQYLDRNLPVPEAFRMAQKAMRKKYPDSPYVWAAFVLIE